MRKRKGIGLVVLTAILLLSGCQNLPGREETVPAKGQESQEEMLPETDLPLETQEKPVMESMPAEPAAGQEPEAGEEASGQQAFKEENQEKGLPEKRKNRQRRRLRNRRKKVCRKRFRRQKNRRGNRQNHRMNRQSRGGLWLRRKHW